MALMVDVACSLVGLSCIVVAGAICIDRAADKKNYYPLFASGLILLGELLFCASYVAHQIAKQ